MKVKVRRVVEVEVAWVRVNVPVRYEDEDMPFDFPFRHGDVWEVDIEMDTGRINNWPGGVGREIYMKVVDQGTYTLYGPHMEVIGRIEEDYVPHGVIPGEFGDYLHFKIDEDGRITNWPKEPDVCQFFLNEGGVSDDY